MSREYSAIKILRGNLQNKLVQYGCKVYFNSQKHNHNIFYDYIFRISIYYSLIKQDHYSTLHAQFSIEVISSIHKNLLESYTDEDRFIIKDKESNGIENAISWLAKEVSEPFIKKIVPKIRAHWKNQKNEKSSYSNIIPIDEKIGRGANSYPIQPKKGLSYIYHALIIGNNNYKHYKKLKTAINDATKISQILKTHFSFNDVKLMLDATRNEIIGELDRYRKQLTEKDSLLIFYAGHGCYDKEIDRAYWVPVDARKDKTANLISSEDLVDKLKGIQSNHILIISDSCYSAKLTRNMSINLDGLLYRYKKSINSKSRTILTSGGNEPVVDSGNNGHSVFAYALIKFFDNNNLPIFDGRIIYKNIYAYVVNNSDQTPHYQLIHSAGHDTGDFFFISSNYSIPKTNN